MNYIYRAGMGDHISLFTVHMSTSACVGSIGLHRTVEVINDANVQAALGPMSTDGRLRGLVY